MATKSIIDIEVNDESFKKFQATFNDYQNKVKNQGSLWHGATKGTDAMGAALSKISDMMEFMAYNSHLMAQNGDKFKKTTSDTGRSMKDLAKNTKNVAGNIINATTSLLKWAGITGIIGGLLGAGGLFGIDRLAASVASKGQAASGRRDRIGAESAFTDIFGKKYGIDTESLLNNVYSMKTGTDISPFIALGIHDYKEKNTADLAVEVLQKTQEFVKRSPAKLLGTYASAFGIDRLMGLQDITRVGDIKNLGASAAQYETTKKSLDISSGESQAWANLVSKLAIISDKIEKIFSGALSPLAPSLAGLGEAIASAIAKVMNSQAMKGWIDDLSKSIKSFASYLTSPEFQEDIEDFMDGLGSIAHTMKKLFGFESRSEIYEKYERWRHLPENTLRQLSRASRSDRDQANTFGIFGLNKDVLKAMGYVKLTLKDSSDVNLNSEMASGALVNMMKEFKGNRDAAIAAVHYGDKVIQKEMINGKFKPTAAQQVYINVFNTTGGSAGVSTNNMGAIAQ